MSDCVCRVVYLCVGACVPMFVKHSTYDMIQVISYT